LLSSIWQKSRTFAHKKNMKSKNCIFTQWIERRNELLKKKIQLVPILSFIRRTSFTLTYHRSKYQFYSSKFLRIHCLHYKKFFIRNFIQIWKYTSRNKIFISHVNEEIITSRLYEYIEKYSGKRISITIFFYRTKAYQYHCHIKFR
jgi:hypothetical protein